jgi:ABC-2 type transport system ATP-binding protein
MGIMAMAAVVQADRPKVASRPAVEISHLRKTYGPLVAVADMSFSVAEGEIFGILGPNGAGKTTTVECAIGLRAADAGTIRLMAWTRRPTGTRSTRSSGCSCRRAHSPTSCRPAEGHRAG